MRARSGDTFCYHPCLGIRRRFVIVWMLTKANICERGWRDNGPSGIAMPRTAIPSTATAIALTRRQKRLLVLGRLLEADASTLSDRAIARELGVSQPFVGAMRRASESSRRSLAGRTAAFPNACEVANGAKDLSVLANNESGRPATSVTTSQQALDRVVRHRRLSRSQPTMPDRGVLFDWDPFA